MITDPVLVKDWHPVARSADLAADKPLATFLLGQDLVLWRSGDRILAWEDLCIHRGAKLSLGLVKAGCLRCPYHGWLYNADGACVKIPAHPEQTPPPRAKAVAYQGREAYGWIWVALSDDPHPLPVFPELNAAGFRTLMRGPFEVKASGPRVIENFLDLAHLMFVHEGILGVSERAEILDYKVIKTDDGVEARDIQLWQPQPIAGAAGSMAHYTYKVLRPLTAYLHKEADGQRFSMMITASPMTETTTKVWIVFAMTGADSLQQDELHASMDQVFLQDVPIMESQHPERLPLDLQSELHLRCDRTSIAYRQWLKEKGLTFGTA